MVFKSPPWVPALPIEIPDSTPVGEFVLNGPGHSRSAEDESHLLTDAVTGEDYSVQRLSERVDHLARALGAELNWTPDKGDPLDKVVGILSLNSPDYLVVCWAVHRLNGIALPLHGRSSTEQLQEHLEASNCKAIFTCPSFAETCDEIAFNSSISSDNIYLIDVSADPMTESSGDTKLMCDLIETGKTLEPLKPLSWSPRQGKSQIAFLASTSGTAGKQKLAKITHYNVISNIIQATTYESYSSQGKTVTGVMVLPLSHTYALHATQILMWRGDRIVLHAKFDIVKMLQSVTRFKAQRLYLIPAICSALAKNPSLLGMFDLSTVHTVVSGGGAFDKELSKAMAAVKPDWRIVVAYGLTETSIIATFGSTHDIVPGSSGSPLPRVEIRLLDFDGTEINEHNKPGLILVKGPNIIPGYLNAEEASRELIDAGGWLHSGDVGLIRPSEKTGCEHLFIVDRMKDMIKVKGMQVSPLNIEAQLMAHPDIQDTAVIGVPHAEAGERAQAYIVRRATDVNDADLRGSISKFIEESMDQQYWLGNRIVFIEEVPRTLSGKALKETLKAWAREGHVPS